jgi:hypothetical protein
VEIQNTKCGDIPSGRVALLHVNKRTGEGKLPVAFPQLLNKRAYKQTTSFIGGGGSDVASGAVAATVVMVVKWRRGQRWWWWW